VKLHLLPRSCELAVARRPWLIVVTIPPMLAALVQAKDIARPLSRRSRQTLPHGKSGMIRGRGKTVSQRLFADRQTRDHRRVHISRAGSAWSARLNYHVTWWTAHGLCPPSGFRTWPLIADGPMSRCRRSTSITTRLRAVTHDPKSTIRRCFNAFDATVSISAALGSRKTHSSVRR